MERFSWAQPSDVFRLATWSSRSVLLSSLLFAHTARRILRFAMEIRVLLSGWRKTAGDMSKYWGEERHSDAIYAVYLKKVRYVPPPGYEGVPRYRPLDPDRQPAEPEEMGADHLQWESVKEKIIKAGTLEKLIEALVGTDDLMDSRHFNVFFATFRAFSDPPTVLDRLLRRYETLENEVNGSTSALVIQNSIRSVLICWLDMYPEDFYDPQQDFAMTTNLLDFGHKHKLTDLRAKTRKLREHFKRIQTDGGMIAQLPSLDQLAYAFGYDVAEYSKNPKDRVKMFDVGKENCVQIAEQLTFWDAALFKELLIHQCQGCVWAKRHKLSPDRVYTVKATIDQFNAVSQRVMTSIVLPDCRPDFRAKIISKWIDIARELRALKNFSSLKAVLFTLQSEPVHRLKSAWQLISSRSISQFKELKSIFDMDDNGDDHNVRKILDQEGTAKSSPLRRPQLIQNCRRTKSDVNLAECQGTVPYLGSFLTDLAMIDQAHSDYTDEGLINFEKRRREFEVLAKLRLFQSAARAYKIPMDRVFCAWFHFLPCLGEKECFSRSLEVEKPPPSTPDISARLNTSTMSNGSGAIKSSTLSRLFNSSRTSEDLSPSPSHSHSHSHSSSHSHPLPGTATPPLVGQLSRDSGFQCEDWIDGRIDGGPPGPVSLATPTGSSTPAAGNSLSWKGGRSLFYNNNIGCQFSPQNVFPHQRAQSQDSTQEVRTSISRSSMDATSTTSRSNTPSMQRMNESFDSKRRINHRHKGSDASTCSSSSQHSQAAAVDSLGFHLARVGLDDDLQTTEGGANYKVIKVINGDRMPEVVARALEKHLIEEAAELYCLVQLLPNGSEFQLPDKCNPFYAMAPDESSHMLNLLLKRRKTETETLSPQLGPSAKKLNKMKRTNLLRWSSGYL